MNRDNWFLVVPTIILGIVATLTLYRLHAAGDVRRAIDVVDSYQAAGRPPLGEYLAAEADGVWWDAEAVSRFYGTIDVICRVQRASGAGEIGLAPAGPEAATTSRGGSARTNATGAGSEIVEYRWRVSVLRAAFAPTDEVTKALMRDYEPALYSEGDEGG